MPGSVLYAAVWLLQEQPAPADDTWVKVIAGIGAAVLIAIVFLRRRAKKKSEDEF